MDFRYKLMRFLSGSYGVDTFFYVLFAFAATLSLINCFLRLIYIQLLVYATVIYALFRTFSRNTTARAKENKIITDWVYTLKKRIDTARHRKADITHIYKRCPKCRAVLRLPRRKGRHKTVCPKCSNEFSVRVYKD